MKLGIWVLVLQSSGTGVEAGRKPTMKLCVQALVPRLVTDFTSTRSCSKASILLQGTCPAISACAFCIHFCGKLIQGLLDFSPSLNTPCSVHVSSSSCYSCPQAHYVKDSLIMLELGLPLLPELVLTLFQARELLKSTTVAKIS